MTNETNNGSGEPKPKPNHGPPVALTKDEFEQRFSDRVEIFSIAMSLDTSEIFFEPLPRNRVKCEEEILKRIAELVNREVSRIVDLVYDETL